MFNHCKEMKVLRSLGHIILQDGNTHSLRAQIAHAREGDCGTRNRGLIVN